MENNPITDNDFGPEEDDRIWKCRIQSAKRLLKQEIKERVHFEFSSDRNMALYLVDACFQIPDGDEKKATDIPLPISNEEFERLIKRKREILGKGDDKE